VRAPIGLLTRTGGPEETQGREDALGARRGTVERLLHGLLVHDGSCSPVCSATMYAAYQSGQFASRCPVRFSCSAWAASARRSALVRSAVDAKVVAAASTRPGSRV
jgi:hypothetical protein